MLVFYVKNFLKTSQFLNPVINLNYIFGMMIDIGLNFYLAPYQPLAMTYFEILC